MNKPDSSKYPTAGRQQGNNLTKKTIVAAVEEMQARHQLFSFPNRIVSDANGTNTTEAKEATHADEPQTVVVAVSGGVDSVCLLQVLQQLAPRWRLSLHVAHLDHALRADSADDANFVAALATSLSLPFHCKHLQPGELIEGGGSVEEAARHARYHFLAHVAHEVTPPGQQPILALAHHADDQAETVLHHLVRGSGLHGLGGMRPVTEQALSHYGIDINIDIDDSLPEHTIPDSAHACLRFVRPFLYVRRATILQYAQEHKLAWREDSTNREQKYTRNFLRHTVLPALTTVNPNVVDAIGRFAVLAGEETARIADYDTHLLQSLLWTPATSIPEIGNQGKVGRAEASTADKSACQREQDQGEVVLKLSALRAQPIATQRALLRLAMRRVDPSRAEVSYEQLTLLCEQISTAGTGGPHPFVGGLQWSIAGETTDRPALLSLHAKGVLPFTENGPLLQRGRVIPLPIVHVGDTTTLSVTQNWQIRLARFKREMLPSDWQDRHQPWRAFFDGAQVQQIQLTTFVHGQTIAPLGLNGHRKQVGDLFTDRKIPAALRPHWPLLVDATTHEVHWVCGIQPGHLARITDTTKEVLCVTLEYL